jgi:hypothetical protein
MSGLPPIPQVPITPIGARNLGEGITWYIDKLQRKGESYVVGVVFFKGFIQKVLTPEYIIFVLNKGEPDKKFLLNAYANNLPKVNNYDQLRLVMNKVNAELSRVTPPKYQGTFFLDRLNEYANMNRMYFAGKKKTRKRKPRRRQTKSRMRTREMAS